MSTTLTDEQLAEYRRKGFVVLRGVFGAEEAEEWASECKRLLQLGLAHEHNIRTTPHYITERLWIVDRFDPVIDISPTFKALTEDERVLAPLRDIYRKDLVLFKDRLIYKMVGMRGYPIHQDYSWWQLFPPELVNVMIAIDGADAENGAVELFPGYQDRLLSTPGEMRHMNEEEARQIDFRKGELPETRPGDVVVFDCLTPHRSGPNLSNRLRRQFYLTYSLAEHGDLYEEQLRLLKEGRSSRRVPEAVKPRLFFR